jgi:predicted CoA-binding protein
MEEFREIFAKIQTIAIVGLSKDEAKDSHRVAKYLAEKGYEIIPINPTAYEIMGKKCYKSLADIPASIAKTIDAIDVFRPSNELHDIAIAAASMRSKFGKPDIFWAQIGISDENAAQIARSAGMQVVMDKCMMIEHKNST